MDDIILTDEVDESKDEYLSDWRRRSESKRALPLDIANAAFERAVQAGDILSEGHDPSEYGPVINLCQRLAGLTALAQGRDEMALARLFANRAVAEASKVDAFDKARFEDGPKWLPLSRPQPFADGRGTHRGRREAA